MARVTVELPQDLIDYVKAKQLNASALLQDEVWREMRIRGKLPLRVGQPGDRRAVPHMSPGRRSAARPRT
jgi:hypothetical protein